LWLAFRDASVQEAYLAAQHAACSGSLSTTLNVAIALVAFATVVAGAAKYGGGFFLDPEYWERFWHEAVLTLAAALCGGLYYGCSAYLALPTPPCLAPMKQGRRRATRSAPQRFDFNVAFFSCVIGAFILAVCWNVRRQLEINSSMPCELYDEGIAQQASNATHPSRAGSGRYVNEFAGYVNESADATPDTACVVSLPVSVLLREPRFQDVVGWFRAILTLAPAMALVMQVPFPLVVLFQSCGVAFIMAFVFVHPSRFDETLPGFSPVVSHVRLYLWNLMPCLIGLTIVYIGQYQRLRMFLVMHKQVLVAARAQDVRYRIA